MCNRDQRLRTLPCSQTLEVYLAVLGDKPVRARTGIGNDRAVLERRTNTALERAVLLLKGGRAADEALAALGQIRAQNEVQLAACTGNLLDAGTFCVHLAEQIHIHNIVDGNEVVDLCDGARIVSIGYRCRHALRIIIYKIVQLLGACAEREHLTAAVDGLLRAVDLACTGDVNECVNVHFSMNAEVLQVRLRDHRAYGIRHAADAQLQARAVRDFLHDQLCNRLINLGRLAACAHLRHFGVALNDHIHLRNVNAVLKAAKAARHILVDLNDDNIGYIADGFQVRSLRTEAEPAVCVHRRHLNHGYIDMTDVLAVPARHLGVAQCAVKAEALHACLALNAGHVPRVPGDLVGCIRNIEYRRSAHEYAAAEVYILQLAHAGSKCLVQCNRRTRTPAVVYPVTRFNNLNGFIRRCQLLLIQCSIIHADSLRLTCSSLFIL